MLVKKLEQLWQQHFFHWVDKRNPPTHGTRLHRKNLFVFPSPVGFGFLLLTVLIWLLGTNYQNNIILALAYTQISLFIVVILNTYMNLSGLHIHISSVKPCHVGEFIEVGMELRSSNKHGSNRVQLCWYGQPVNVVDVSYGEVSSAIVYCKVDKRGLFRPGRLLIDSRFPMGLVRCWSWMNTDLSALVYPSIIENTSQPSEVGREQAGEGTDLRAGDDFWGLKPYQAGEPLRHIAWKHYAKGKGLYSKEYAESVNADTWIMWSQFFDGDVELTLGRICYWALKLHNDQIPFGLTLPGIDIKIDSGLEHKEKVLYALAMFDPSAERIQ